MNPLNWYPFSLLKGDPSKPKSKQREFIEMVVSVVILVFFIRLAVVEAFRIPTSSMEDTLLVGDFLLVNKFLYGVRSPDWVGVPFTKVGFSVPFFRMPGFRKPRPGDIIVFRYPLDRSLNYIKRLVAVEGQTVQIIQKKVYVDGELFEDPTHSKFSSPVTYPPTYKEESIFPRNLDNRNRDNYGPVTVPSGSYFVLGDNRDNSADSRYWGFVPEKDVVGKALVIYFSYDAHKALSQLNAKVRWERIGNLIR